MGSGARAASSASFSAGVPTVIRRQSASQRMIAVQVLDEDAGLRAATRTTRRASGTRTSTKLVSVGKTLTSRLRGERVHEARALGPDRRRLLRQLVRRARG